MAPIETLTPCQSATRDEGMHILENVFSIYNDKQRPAENASSMFSEIGTGQSHGQGHTVAKNGEFRQLKRTRPYLI